MQCRKEQDDVKNALSKRRVISPAVIWLLAGRHPAYRQHEHNTGSGMERGNLSSRCEGDQSLGCITGQPRKREEPVIQSKQFALSRQAVWSAYKKVKANKGSAGIDGQSIEEFDKNLVGNLYKIWNRMASGSYMPPAVRRVEMNAPTTIRV